MNFIEAKSVAPKPFGRRRARIVIKHLEAPSRQATLLSNLGEVKSVAPKPFGRRRARIVIKHLEATSRHATLLSNLGGGKSVAPKPFGRRRARIVIKHLEASSRQATLLSNLGGVKSVAPKPFGRRRMKFYYVYILQSEIDQRRFCTGFTEDLDTRLKSHNSGGCHHTSKHRPWRIKTAIAFNGRQKALDFEEYLKSPSGRAFAKKRL